MAGAAVCGLVSSLWMETRGRSSLSAAQTHTLTFGPDNPGSVLSGPLQPLDVPVPGTLAKEDPPLPNGPAPLLWQTSGTRYRASHFVAMWNPQRAAWQALSPDVTEAYTPGTPGYGIDGITALAHQGDVWYTGTLAGEVCVALPGHPWAKVTAPLPDRTVTALAICPNADGQVAALGLGGYGSATPDQPGHVYLTLNGGQSWQDVSAGLPDQPVQSLSFQAEAGHAALTVWLDGQAYQWQGAGHWQAISTHLR
ncbi:MAG: hypothetical protein K6T26_05950 [Alicyclobacillus sp.]|nr:hypothetical protein [Alicyclobacillus sp.]